MQDFIVLGLIPGTHIQINFYFWLIVFASAVTIWVIWRERYSLRAAFLAQYVAWLIRRRNLTA